MLTKDINCFDYVRTAETYKEKIFQTKDLARNYLEQLEKGDTTECRGFDMMMDSLNKYKIVQINKEIWSSECTQYKPLRRMSNSYRLNKCGSQKRDRKQRRNQTLVKGMALLKLKFTDDISNQYLWRNENEEKSSDSETGTNYENYTEDVVEEDAPSTSVSRVSRKTLKHSATKSNSINPWC